MSTDRGQNSQADSDFVSLATAYLDDRAQRHPNLATDLGDHRFDTHLPEYSAAAVESERAAVDGFAARLEAIDTSALSAENQVDAGMLANGLRARTFELDELRERSWNPLLANPGRAIYRLLTRDFAPLPDRLASVAGRLAEVPAMLAGARGLLGAMPKVHLETAIGQFDGTIGLVTRAVDAALEEAPQCAGQIGAARPAALDALTQHRAWLAARLAEGVAGGGFAEPRIGAERFARKLSLTLDTAADSDAILARAHDDLDRVNEEITRLATELAAPNGGPRSGGDVVRQELDRPWGDAPDDTSILDLCRRALTAQTTFVEENRLISNPHDPVQVAEMPEIDRGIGVAYCDSPGALESAPIPTVIAVSPTPRGWPAERIASFYREYNRHMVHNLMVHEAMPGHYLHLQHSRRFRGSTALRAVLRSGAFTEGWAVYAERLMVDRGYPGDGDPRQVRMQQLKMQLRMIINAILDARVHAHGMTEAEAMSLMTGRGYQEEGEAAGKWRRALLSSAQLSTYYVGYTEVSDLVTELKTASPQQPEQQVHDGMLSHGTPPVRRLRPLLGR